MHGVGTFVKSVRLHDANSQYLSTHACAAPSMIYLQHCTFVGEEAGAACFAFLPFGGVPGGDLLGLSGGVSGSSDGSSTVALRSVAVLFEFATIMCSKC